jgi:hypothetical protein
MEDGRKILVTNFISDIDELQRDAAAVFNHAPGEEQRHWNSAHHYLRLAKQQLLGMIGPVTLVEQQPLRAPEKITAEEPALTTEPIVSEPLPFVESSLHFESAPVPVKKISSLQKIKKFFQWMR